MLEMDINGHKVDVSWEDNSSVKALEELAPITIEMSAFGGFEQVGDIGARLPSNDMQTVTSAGDIVLYSSDKLVVFYGSNSWVYTRLGHIEGMSEAELTDLLTGSDVKVDIKRRKCI